MKKLLVLVATLAVGFVFAESQSYEDQVAERLKPAGNVCIAGQVCETATAAASSSADAGPKSGDEVYSTACAACHASGVLAAPRFGNVEDWAPRLTKGADTLHANAINGINAMPAKGGNSALSDDEVIAAVDYMIEGSQ